MSKKNKKGIVLLASLLTFSAITATSLVSCGDKNVTEEEKITSLAISNKDALTKEWHVGDSNRKITLAAAPEDFNVAEAINNGDITITSSDETVLSVNGQYLTALKEGKATVTVSGYKLSDSVEITVLAKVELPTTSIKDAFADAFTKGAASHQGSTGETKYLVKGKIVAYDGADDGVIYDGKNYGLLRGEIKGANVGDVVTIEGNIGNYYGSMQLNVEIVTKLTETIELPALTAITSEAITTYQNAAIKSNNGIANVEDIYYPIRGNIVGVYEGVDNFDGINVRFNDLVINYKETTAEMLEEFKKVTVGSEVTVESTIISYNNSFKYFKAIPNKLTVTGEVITPTSITLSASSLKLDRFGTTELTTTLLPEGASGQVTYEIIEGKDKAIIDRDVLGAYNVGTIKVVAKVNNLTSDPVTITAAYDDANTNIYENATEITVDELVDLNVDDTVSNTLYQLTGVVSGLDSAGDYGKITLTSKTSNKSFKAYGTNGAFFSFYFKDDNTLAQNSSKLFQTDVKDVLFSEGDTVEFFAQKYNYTNAEGVTTANYKLAFRKFIEKAPAQEPSTPVTGTTLTYDFSTYNSGNASTLPITVEGFSAIAEENSKGALKNLSKNGSVFIGDNSNGQTEINGLKLGASKSVASLDFEFFYEIVGVKVYARQYKTYSSEIKVNDFTQVLTVGQTHAGEEIVVNFDTPTKTVSIGTTGNSDSANNKMNRCWISKIEFTLKLN